MSVRKSETSFRHSGFLGQEVAGKSWLGLCAPCSTEGSQDFSSQGRTWDVPCPQRSQEKPVPYVFLAPMSAASMALQSMPSPALPLIPAHVPQLNFTPISENPAISSCQKSIIPGI